VRPEGGRERLNCRLYLWPRQRTTKRNAHDLTGSPRCHDGVWGGKNVKMSSLSHLVWGRGRRDHPPFCPSRKIHTCQISSVISATLREKRRVEARQVPHFCCMCARSNSAGMISNGNAKDASTTFLLSESTQVWTLCWWTPNNC